MNYTALKSEVTFDPTGRGYLAHLANAPGMVVQLLNEPVDEMNKPRFITVRTMLAELGVAGAVIAEKLSQFAASAPSAIPEVEGLRLATKWAMRFIDSDGEGLDIGHANTHTMIDGMAAIAVLTNGEAENLKSLAWQPASRAEIVCGIGTYVTVEILRTAMVEG